jgi:hypothetical protein
VLLRTVSAGARLHTLPRRVPPSSSSGHAQRCSTMPNLASGTSRLTHLSSAPEPFLLVWLTSSLSYLSYRSSSPSRAPTLLGLQHAARRWPDSLGRASPHAQTLAKLLVLVVKYFVNISARRALCRWCSTLVPALLLCAKLSRPLPPSWFSWLSNWFEWVSWSIIPAS